MKKYIFFLVMGLAPILLGAQNPNGNYNPFVEEATVSPSPLLPSANGGRGEISFSVGNMGTDPLDIYSNHRMILTITLSNGEPEGDAISAVSGSFAGYFSWTYKSGTYKAEQISEIPAKSSGTIKIAFEVLKNSVSPGSNGFNVNITPSPYQNTSNIQQDDAVSAYTYTGEATSLNEMEASRFSIYPNPSRDEIMIKLDGASGSYLLEIIASSGSIVKQDVLNLTDNPVSKQLRDLIPGVYEVQLTKGELTYKQKLIIVE